MPASQYVEAVEASELAKVAQEYESAIETLSTFLAVVAEGRIYEEAIAPYKDSARVVLDDLKSLDSPFVSDAVAEECKSKALFLSAASVDDLDTQEGSDLLDQIGDSFSLQVHRGLLLHKYSLSDPTTSRVGDHIDGCQTQTAEGVKRPLKNIEAISDVQGDIPTNSPGEPGGADSIAGIDENHIEMEGESKTSLRSVASRPAKRVSASSFKRDLLTSAPKATKVTLPLITFFGALTRTHAEELVELMTDGDCPKARVPLSIDYLMKEGVIEEHEVGESIVLCLSETGHALLSKESIRSMKSGRSNYWTLNIPGKIDRIIPDQSDDVIANRIHLAGKLVLFANAMADKYRREHLGRTRHSFTIDEDTITVRVYWEKETFDCLLMDGDEVPSDPGDIVMILGADDPVPPLPRDYMGNAFVIREGAISRIEITDSDEEDAADGFASNAGESADSLADGDELSDTNVAEAVLIEAAEGGEDIATDSDDDPDAIHVEVDSPQDEDRRDEVAPAVIEPTDLVSEGDSRVEEEDDSEDKAVDSSSEVIEGFSDKIDFEGTSASIAAALAGRQDTPNDELFIKLAGRLVGEIKLDKPSEAEYGNLGLAMTLLSASSQIEGHEQRKKLLELIDLATGLGMCRLDRSGTGIARAFTGNESKYEPLMLGALIAGMVAPKALQDYTLKSMGSGYLKSFSEIFPSYPEFKPLLNCLNRALNLFFESGPREGFSNRVIMVLDDRKASKKAVDEVSREAKTLVNPPRFNTYVNGTAELVKTCLGKGSDLYECMQIIANGNWSDRELVEATLDLYLDEDTGEISDDAIGNTIDRVWRQLKEKDSSIKVETLRYNSRDKAFDAFRSRLGVMKRWLELDLASAEGMKTERLIELRRELVDIIDELTQPGAHRHKGEFDAALYWSLISVRGTLTGSPIGQSIFYDFLKTGLVSLDKSGHPLLPEKLAKYKYCEPWRDVLAQITSDRFSFEEAAARVFDPDSPMFDNLGQLAQIGQVLGSPDPQYLISEDQIFAAEKSAEADTSEFIASLEIDYTYNRINEAQEEDLLVLMEGCKQDFYELRNFGSWRRVLAGLRRQVDDYSAERDSGLKDRLSKCRASLRRKSSTLLDEVERLLCEDRNYAVAEEYLNRFDAGERDLPKEQRQEVDSFSEFLSDEVFNPIYDLCNQSKGKPLPSFAAQFVKDRYPFDWTNRQKESSAALIKNWPVSNRRTDPNSIANLMREIFGVQAREATEKYPGTRYELTFVQAKRDLANYPHPIASFGTLASSPINIIVLYGNQTPKDIIDRVAKENVVGMSVILVNHPMRVATRRQLAELFHTQQSRLNPFILIDQVLAIHLALHQQAERLPLLLKCTLPFTYYQPFVRGSGATANEMFCGRDDELRKILDPKGASVVYGGRQLGKTALLTRAQSLANYPEKKEYAVFVTILSCHDEESVALAISEELKNQHVPYVGTHTNLKSLCDGIRAQMDGGNISRMLLLIDECDNFLESISVDSYLAIQPLVDLKRSTSNAFKFVIAGLHNVCRAKNASERNGIIPQLGDPLCIKPLQPNDALQLITRPLMYLGFHIDQYPYLITILTNTNYYPGIIQFFGYELIESMTKQYGDYYRAVDGNPPYTLQEAQLGAIMASADLNKSIKEKFRWSLELDERYFMIARCVAMLYYEYAEEGNLPAVQDGFSVGDIKENAEGWGIRCLSTETIQTYTNLLDEMVDMGILSKPHTDQNRYRLRRYSFLNIIGPTPDSVFEDIDEYNTEG